MADNNNGNVPSNGVPVIYQKQVALLRAPFDVQRGVYAPVMQWCADHAAVLEGVHADARRAIEDALRAIDGSIARCQAQLGDLFGAAPPAPESVAAVAEEPLVSVADPAEATA